MISNWIKNVILLLMIQLHRLAVDQTIVDLELG
jgi:hypothetical protein